MAPEILQFHKYDAKVSRTVLQEALGMGCQFGAALL
jgi:hypothetical protein